MAYRLREGIGMTLTVCLGSVIAMVIAEYHDHWVKAEIQTFQTPVQFSLDEQNATVIMEHRYSHIRPESRHFESFICFSWAIFAALCNILRYTTGKLPNRRDGWMSCLFRYSVLATLLGFGLYQRISHTGVSLFKAIVWIGDKAIEESSIGITLSVLACCAVIDWYSVTKSLAWWSLKFAFGWLILASNDTRAGLALHLFSVDITTNIICLFIWALAKVWHNFTHRIRTD